VRWKSFIYEEFSYESNGERTLKIGLSNIKGGYFFETRVDSAISPQFTHSSSASQTNGNVISIAAKRQLLIQEAQLLLG